MFEFKEMPLAESLGNPEFVSFASAKFEEEKMEF